MGLISKGGRLHAGKKKVSPPLLCTAACGPVKLPCCAVYKKGWDRDLPLLTCQVLVGPADDAPEDQ